MALWRAADPGMSAWPAVCHPCPIQGSGSAAQRSQRLKGPRPIPVPYSSAVCGELERQGPDRAGPRDHGTGPLSCCPLPVLVKSPILESIHNCPQARSQCPFLKLRDDLFLKPLSTRALVTGGREISLHSCCEMMPGCSCSWSWHELSPAHLGST